MILSTYLSIIFNVVLIYVFLYNEKSSTNGRR